MALSHEILWREKRENSPIPFGPDFINLENWNLPPPFLGKLFKSLSFALPLSSIHQSISLSSIHQSIWLAGFGTPPFAIVGISSLFAPFFGVGRTTA